MTVRRGLRGGLAVMVAVVLAVMGGAAAFGADATPTPNPTQASPTASPAPTVAPPTPTPTTSTPTAPTPTPTSASSPVPVPAAAPAAVDADANVILAAHREVAPGGRVPIRAAADLVSGSAAAVVLVVDLPAGTTYVPADPHTAEGQSCRATGQRVTCRDEQPDIGGGTFAGGTLLLRVGRDVPVGTALPITARAAVEGATDPVPGNDTATDSLHVVAELNVGISWGAARYETPPGGDLVLRLTVVNHGDAPVATFVGVTDAAYADGTIGLPRSGLTALPPNQPEGTCFGDPGEIGCDLVLAAGQQEVLEYAVMIDPSDAGHVLSVRATSETGSVDATETDNASVARIVVAAAPTAPSTPQPPADSTASALPSELAATGPDQRAALLVVLGLLFMTSGVAAVRFSTRR